MSIVYSDAVKIARLGVVQTAIEADAGVGAIRIYTASYTTLLATVPVEDSQVASGTGTVTLALIDAPSSVNAVGTGTAAIARLCDNSGDIVASNLSVNTAAADVILDSVNITSGQNVTINSAVITHG